MNITKTSILLEKVFGFSKYTKDASGNVTELVGPSGASSLNLSTAISTATPLNKTIGTNFWLAGDSQAYFAREALSAPTQYAGTLQSPWTFLNSFLEGSLLQINNTGLSGSGVEHLIDTQLAQIQNYKVNGYLNIDTVWLEVGINDFYLDAFSNTDGSASYCHSADFVAAGVTRFLKEMSQIGVRVILLNTCPVGTNMPANLTNTAGRLAQHQAYVTWTRNVLPYLFPQHIIVDSYALCVQADGVTPKTGYLYDGLHHDIAACYAIARQVLNQTGIPVATTYSRITSSRDYRGSALGARIRNGFAASIIVGTVGDTSLPSGWTNTGSSNATATYKIKANPYGGAGNQIEVNVTFTAAGNFYVGLTEAAVAVFGAGQYWYPSAKIDIVNTNGAGNSIIKHVPIRGSLTDGSTPYYSWGGYSRNTTNGFPQDMLGLEECGAYQQTPVGFSQTAQTFLCYMESTGAGTATFRICEPAIWQLGFLGATITSGFGTSPAIVATGSKTFKVTVGSAPGSTGVLYLGVAANGWVVTATNLTSNSTLTVSQSAGNTTTATLTSYSRTTGLATAFNASDVILITAAPY